MYSVVSIGSGQLHVPVQGSPGLVQLQKHK